MTSEPDRGRGLAAGVTRYDHGHLARRSARQRAPGAAVLTVALGLVCPESTS